MGIEASEIKITEHSVYTALDKTAVKRHAAYRYLFEHQIPERTIEEIRVATNKAWVLDNDEFQQKIEIMSKRQAKPKLRGGGK